MHNLQRSKNYSLKRILVLRLHFFLFIPQQTWQMCCTRCFCMLGQNFGILLTKGKTMKGKYETGKQYVGKALNTGTNVMNYGNWITIGTQKWENRENGVIKYSIVIVIVCVMIKNKSNKNHSTDLFPIVERLPLSQCKMVEIQQKSVQVWCQILTHMLEL